MSEKYSKKEVTEIKQKIIAIQEKTKCNVKAVNADEARLINKYSDPLKELNDSTKFIHRNLNILMEVAAKLRIVKENKLYRLKYDRFEDYLKIEFNYTRSRAYQLTRADEVAKYINFETGQTIITNEAQCRELLRLKIYKDKAHQEVDTEESNKARLKLVNQLTDEYEKVEATVLSENIDKIMEENQNFVRRTRKVDEFNDIIEKTCKGVRTVVNNVINSKKWSEDEKQEIIAKASDELKNLWDAYKGNKL